MLLLGRGGGLLVDPLAVLGDQRRQRRAQRRGVRRGGERLHPELDVLQFGGFDTLDLALRHPCRLRRAAFPSGHDAVYGRTVADGEFQRVAVLQVGDPLIRIVMLVAARIGTSDERAI